MSLNSSSNSSLHPELHHCILSTVSFPISTAILITTLVFLLPPLILVVYVGFQRWRKQRSVGTAAATSHSDVFTFNMVAVEMIGIVGALIIFYGTCVYRESALKVGMIMYSIVSPGQVLFHLLTCVERYLAVVHPVTYMGLRQAGGVRIRNISVGCVWIISFGSLGLSNLTHSFLHPISDFLLLVFSSAAISFCSLSVLCILIRPGPGEVGGNRERVDQSKQKAFHTMAAISGALLLRFLSSLVTTLMTFSSALSKTDLCILSLSLTWFDLPSSLVLPLLFLHRAGKLPGCERSTESA